jgi:hypothetical protein
LRTRDQKPMKDESGRWQAMLFSLFSGARPVRHNAA